MNEEIYVGPYIVAETEYRDIKKTELGCPKCKKWMRYAFCPRCGEKKGTYEYTKKGIAVDDSNVREEIRESLFCVTNNSNDLRRLWIPNSNIPGIERTLHYGDEDDTETVILSETVTDEQKHFSIKFSKELELMQNQYKSIEIRWGVVTYWN